MNMRFTGITGNRAQLGFNEVEFLVNDFLGKTGKLNGYSNNKVGARQVACTTVPPSKIEKPVYTILGGGSMLASYYVNELINQDQFQQINLICRNESFAKYQTLFNDNRIVIVNESDNLLETAYCQSYVLINFVCALAFKPEDEKFRAIMFLYDQIQKVI